MLKTTLEELGACNGGMMAVHALALWPRLQLITGWNITATTVGRPLQVRAALQRAAPSVLFMSKSHATND